MQIIKNNESDRCHVDVMKTLMNIMFFFDMIKTQMMVCQRRECYSTASHLTGCTRLSNAQTTCSGREPVYHMISDNLKVFDIRIQRPEQQGPKFLCALCQSVWKSWQPLSEQRTQTRMATTQTRMNTLFSSLINEHACFLLRVMSVS